MLLVSSEELPEMMSAGMVSYFVFFDMGLWFAVAMYQCWKYIIEQKKKGEAFLLAQLNK